MKAWSLLERIREKMADTLGGIELEGPVTELDFFRSILGLEATFVESVRRELFMFVYFTNEAAQTRQRLGGAEDTAFEKLEPFAVYEVLLRALAVNFFPSLHASGLLPSGVETQEEPTTKQ